MKAVIKTTLFQVLVLITVVLSGQAHAAFDWWGFGAKPKSAPPQKVEKIWILKTEFNGELATRLAVADQFPDAEVILVQGPAEKVALKVDQFLHRQFDKNTLSKSEWPDLIIHSFAQANEVEFLLDIKKHSGGKTFLVNFDDPGSLRDQFDLVVMPRHLNAAFAGTNVLRPIGLPTRLTPERLREAKLNWAQILGVYPGPIVSVFVGGQTKAAVFPAEQGAELGQKVAQLTRQIGGSVLVANSRRTPEPTTVAMINELTRLPVYFKDWKDVQGENENPYTAMFAYADFIVITGDSLSMLSDAVSTGKPVFVYAPNQIVEDRHRRLIVNLYQSGRIQILNDKFEAYDYQPLNVGSMIRDEITSRLCDRVLNTKRR